MQGLVLHCGANNVERKQVLEVPTPEPTKTWFPIPHDTLITRVEEALASLNLRVTEAAHALTREGLRYFGLLRVTNGHAAQADFGYVLGLRNSHDQAFCASIAVGSEVFVCDNLAFSGEITIARKHTRFIQQDLPRLTGNAIGLLSQKWTVMADRYNEYKRQDLTDMRAHDLMIRALEIQATTVTQLPDVIDQWRNPQHPEFAEQRNVWRLFNAFTGAAKESSLTMLPQRTIRLHGLMDTAVGFKAPEMKVTDGTVEADAAVVNVRH
jgi:hypothetical protein